MGKIIDAMERALFGATAQERVDMMIELASRRAQARMEERLIAALELDDDETSDLEVSHGEE